METEENDNQNLPFDHKMDLSSYKYPPLDLLNKGSSTLPISAEELDRSKHIIIETLNYARIEIDSIKATIGPRITLYEIVPAPGVRISQIVKMEADISLQLARSGVKVIGAIKGKGTIGIEVPHENPSIVTLRSIFAKEKFLNSTMQLPLAIGKTSDGEVFIIDLVAVPHLLIAGSTGQGKSVLINAIIASLLFQKHPSELKFILIDFNKLELTPFKKIEHHFLAKLPDSAEAIITDILSAVNTLNSLGAEIDQRYELFKYAQVRSIKEYNQKYTTYKINNPENRRYLPFLVVVIEEFADLVSQDNSVEALITRLAQLGRPAGVHLIISTQRPSVKVITGNIKANFISRIALKVASSIDSRTIIDKGGAEELKGDGDMLYYTGIEVLNLQGTYVAIEEIENICEFVSGQVGYPTAMLLPNYPDNESYDVNDFDPGNLDPMFEEAARLVVMHQQGSTSLIQRKLKLGYNRAGRIMDQMEAAGIVGPFEGSKAREVLHPDEYSLLVYLESLNSDNVIKPLDSKVIDTAVPPDVNYSIPEVAKKKSFFDRLFNR